MKRKKWRSVVAICFAMVLWLQIPVLAEDLPEITAQTAIVMEKSTGKIIYEKGMHQKIYPASMTKMITALVTLDYLKPEDVLTVGAEINEVTLDSSKAGHRRGENISVETLIRGLIIPSGNDSANVLAAAVAKKVKQDDTLSYTQCEEVFTGLMNEKAKALGALDTHFSNAHGYHNDNHYSSAYDMALFSAAAMDNELIRQIAKEKSFSGPGAPAPTENTQTYDWQSHNLLIRENEYVYPYAVGIKTGFTNEAGDCVASAAEKDGTTLIAVVCNAPDPARWLDAKHLFEYTYANYSMCSLHAAGAEVSQVPLTKHNRLNGDMLSVVTESDISEYVKTSDADAITEELTYLPELAVQGKDGETVLQAPIAKGAKVGTMVYQLKGETLQEVPVYAAQEIEKQTIGNTVQFFFRSLGEKIFTWQGLVAAVGIVALVVLIFGVRHSMQNRRNRYQYRLKPMRKKKRF